MTETVTSKFRKSLWIAPFLLGILVLALIAVCAGLWEHGSGPGDAHSIIGALAVLIALICYNTYHAVKRFIKVTVSPDVLLLNYLLINNQKTVNYADIAHISVMRENPGIDGVGARSVKLIDTIKLKIELNNGKKIYLFEEYYENFDELKEAIRRARFKLN